MISIKMGKKYKKKYIQFLFAKINEIRFFFYFNI